MAKLKEYTGSTLRIGSFLEMMQEYCRLITELTPASLKLDNEAPVFLAKVDQLEKLVKRLRAFEETAGVATEDQTRDSIWKALFYVHRYLEGLPETHPLYVYVNRLSPVFHSYKSMHLSELMEQTAQVRGFLSEMARPANAEAAQKLGMDKLIAALEASNNDITQWNAARTTAAYERQTELGEETTDDVRRQLVNLYRGIVERVNGANLFYPSATITEFIGRANTIADHYRVIGKATTSSGSSSGTTTPTTPDNGGSTNNGGGTTTPDTPDNPGGGTNTGGDTGGGSTGGDNNGGYDGPGPDENGGYNNE